MDEQIIEFEKVLDQACKSKFIMVDKRISDILKCIAASEPIYETIKRTLIGFDFGKELKIATNIEGHFSMPTDDIRAVALTFCILNAIDDKKIEITQLLANNFAGEDPYSRFCDVVFVRFKTAVLSLMGSAPTTNDTERPRPKVSPVLLDRAAFLAGQLEEYIKPEGRKYYDCLIKSIKMADREFIEVFFELACKNVSRHAKTLLKELSSVVEVIVKQ